MRKNISRITAAAAAILIIMGQMYSPVFGAEEMETETAEEALTESKEEETAAERTTETSGSHDENSDESTDDKDTSAKQYTVSAKDMPAGGKVSEGVVNALGVDSFFYVEEISDELFERMWGKSYKENCTIPRESLRYIRVLHKDIDGQIKIGELVMNVLVADTVCEIFRKLYDADYPIESMLLIDEYAADDETSIMHNNTSAFNFRTVDNTDQISNHAYGLAIDINPYYNVYYIPSENYIFPEDGWQYLDRDSDFPYKVEPGDLCYNLFTEAGFEWGGWWTYNTDYQHFQYIPDESEINWN